LHTGRIFARAIPRKIEHLFPWQPVLPRWGTVVFSESSRENTMSLSPRSFRPSLELLEDRLTPALRLSLLPTGILTVTGTLSNPNASLVVRQTAQDTWTVIQDVDPFTPGGEVATASIRASRDLRIDLARFFDNILVDLNDFTYSGNITINTGTGGTIPAPGPRVVAVYDGVDGGPVGGVRGNVLFLGGSGNEIYSIGLPQATGLPTAVDLQAEVFGNVTVVPREPRGAFPYDTFFVGPNSTVRGNVTAINVEFPTLGVLGAGPATVLGTVTLTQTNRTKFLNANLFGTFGKNVNATSLGVLQNTFTLGAIVPGDTTVRGNVSVNYSAANLGPFTGDVLQFDDGATVQGNLYWRSGLGDDTILFNGDLNGSGNFELTGGANVFTFSATGFVGGNLRLAATNEDNIVDIDGEINGDFSAYFGNGANDFNFNADMAIGGHVNLYLGNGNNTVDLVDTALVGGRFRLRTGNGNNTVDLDASGGVLVTDIIFGNGDDDLTFRNGTFSGKADGGGRVTANTFTLVGAVLTPDFVLVNFP
jgi:hypothetical protein